MQQENEYVDPLSRIIKDHQDVSEYLEVLDQVLGFALEEQAWDKLKPIENFFQKNLTKHFEFEEKILFPAILSQIPTEDSISFKILHASA